MYSCLYNDTKKPNSAMLSSKGSLNKIGTK
ncbi:UNVERIFIED_CONTAM: hypothetical protein GTU68_027360 [Idotea baltica]|nr:hypothetical protein [Idotea baltica]